MKITFELADETTVTNSTVKVAAYFTGQVGDDDRTAINTRVSKLSKKLFDDVSWAFSDFSYQNNGMMFRVMGTARIDASRNDQLERLASDISNNKTAVQISNIDASIPMRDIRSAESELRKRLIALAGEEATGLGGDLVKVSFLDRSDYAPRGGARMVGATSASYAKATDGGQLGHSEKIALSATVTVLSA